MAICCNDVACFSLLLLASCVISSATATLKPTKSFETWFAVEQPPSLPFDAVQSVVDFPPAGFVARHTHGGPLYAVMIQGSITLWIDGEPAKTSHKGDPIVEPYRKISSAANPSTAQFATLLATYLIPVGANLTTFEPSASTPSPPPPGPSSRFQSRMRVDSAPKRNYRVCVYLLTFEPGAWAVPETVVAPRLMTVVSGEVTTVGSAGKTTTFRAGEFWIARPGDEASLVAEGNFGNEKAVVVVSVVPL